MKKILLKQQQGQTMDVSQDPIPSDLINRLSIVEQNLNEVKDKASQVNDRINQVMETTNALNDEREKTHKTIVCLKYEVKKLKFQNSEVEQSNT